MDTISHSETSLLGKFYMHQENSAPLMTKNVNFAFFPWILLGHSKKTLKLTVEKMCALAVFTQWCLRPYG